MQKSNNIKLKEAVMALVERIRGDRKFAIYFASCVVAVVVIVIVLILLLTGGKKDGKDSVSGNSSASGNSVSANYVVKEEALSENTNEELGQVINTFFAALAAGDTATIQSLKVGVSENDAILYQKKSAYIENYNNIKIYTKSGPVEDSYVCFVTFEVKFKDYESSAPGLLTLYACKNADGAYYIEDADSNPDIENYIKVSAVADDVVELFDKIKGKYNKVVDADPALKDFLTNLTAQLETEMTAELEAKKAEADAAAAAAAEAEAAAAAATPAEAAPATTLIYKVVTTDTVNVRASDSEIADKLGKVDVGTVLVILENRENGWSKVQFNGQDGYIKTEFLQSAGTEEVPAQTDAAAPAAEPATDAAATTGTAAVTDGKVTIKETVNIRKSANETGERVGVAYQGETYELIMEQADGWCKIKYKGETAYVKTEFVQ